MYSRILSVSALVLVFVAGAKAAEELPKRKAGLWEIQNQMQGAPSMAGPIQLCTDEKSDNILQQRAGEMKQECSAMDWKKDGEGIVVNSVCKVDDTTTATARAVFTGSFQSNYRGDIHSTFDPPMHGMKEMDMLVTAKWVGPCKPGQKGGDVAMPGMGGPGGMKNIPNMKELMKMQERMKGTQME